MMRSHVRKEDERRRKKKIANRKDEIRRLALIDMKEVANTMDGLMRETPYSSNHDYMRLRATLALYLGDLFMPANEVDTANFAESQKLRDREHQNARDLMVAIMTQGGQLDQAALSFLSLDPETHISLSSHIYSTLPIRPV